MSDLLISEVFGPTIQGEGPHAGQRAGFVRLGACNLACSWCDTPYTWDGARFDLRAELTRMPVSDVLDQVAVLGCALVVISGGEPLLQQDHTGRHVYGLADLARALGTAGHTVDIETNGTLAATADLIEVVDLFVVSPKLAHAGMTEARRIRPAILNGFARLADHGAAVFKFVARTREDVDRVAALVARHEIPPGAVWIMPEGIDAQTIMARGRVVAEMAIEAGFNYSTRSHVLLWGSERAR